MKLKSKILLITVLLLSIYNIVAYGCSFIRVDKRHKSTLKKLVHTKNAVFTGTVIAVNNVAYSDTENLIGLDRIIILLKDSIQGVNFRDTMLIYNYPEGVDSRYRVVIGQSYIFECGYTERHTDNCGDYPPFLFLDNCGYTCHYNYRYVTKLKRYHLKNPKIHKINRARLQLANDKYHIHYHY